jgi:hypothetical protein
MSGETRAQVAWDAVRMALGVTEVLILLAVIAAIAAVGWLLVRPWMRRSGGPRS